jgi:hypothetical protein
MNARHRILVSLLAAFGMMALPHQDLRGQPQGQRDRAVPANNRQNETPRADPSAPETSEDPWGKQASEPRVEIDPMELKFSYSSPQSNVAAFVEALVGASNDKLNIVVTPEASKVSLPNIKLENVKIRNALRLLSRIHPDLMIDEDNDAGDNDESRVILIGWNGPQPQENPAYRVIGVKHLLGTLDQSSLMAAFDDGYQFIHEGGEKPEIRLHEPTGLLFVKGTEAQVEFAAEILAALSGSQGLSAPPFGYSGGMGSMGGGMPGGGIGGMGIGGRGGMGMEGGISGAPPHGGAGRYSGGRGAYGDGAGGGSGEGGGAVPGFGSSGSGGPPPSYPFGGGGAGSLDSGAGAGPPGNK